MFFKIDALKSFVNFKERHMFWSLFLIKLQVSKPFSIISMKALTGTQHKLCENMGFC